MDSMKNQKPTESQGDRLLITLFSYGKRIFTMPDALVAATQERYLTTS